MYSQIKHNFSSIRQKLYNSRSQQTLEAKNCKVHSLNPATYNACLEKGSNQPFVTLYTYTIYLSLYTQTADPNPLHSIHTQLAFVLCGF